MESLIKSDLFFFITSLSVIILTIFWLFFLVIISFFGFKILKNIKIISDIFKDQSEKISQNIEKTRDDVNDVRKEAKTSALLLFKFFNSMVEKILKPKGRKKDNKK